MNLQSKSSKIVKVANPNAAAQEHCSLSPLSITANSFRQNGTEKQIFRICCRKVKFFNFSARKNRFPVKKFDFSQRQLAVQMNGGSYQACRSYLPLYENIRLPVGCFLFVKKQVHFTPAFDLVSVSTDRLSAPERCGNSHGLSVSSCCVSTEKGDSPGETGAPHHTA